MKNDVFLNAKWSLMISMVFLTLVIPLQAKSSVKNSAALSVSLLSGNRNPTICSGSSVKLKADAGSKQTVKWFRVPVGGSPVGTGKIFITPTLTTTTTYYYETNVWGIPKVPERPLPLQ
jgi:hypothetical protein